MMYKVKEYYLNGETPHEIETYVKARTAILAIKTKPFWKYASDFTAVKPGNSDSQLWSNAHTQDGNGKNGCQAVRVSAEDYKCRLRETADGGFQFGFTARPDQMAGTMEPFRPHWWCQYMGNGASYIADDYRDMLKWMRDY